MITLSNDYPRSPTNAVAHLHKIIAFYRSRQQVLSPDSALAAFTAFFSLSAEPFTVVHGRITLKSNKDLGRALVYRRLHDSLTIVDVYDDDELMMDEHGVLAEYLHGQKLDIEEWEWHPDWLATPTVLPPGQCPVTLRHNCEGERELILD